ncbi:MAG: hypothetical protein ACI9U2_004640 [Bradymonadia bacterium]
MISLFLVAALGAPPTPLAGSAADAASKVVAASKVDAEPVDAAVLRSVRGMSRAQIARALADGLPARVAAMLDSQAPLPDRLLAARALGRLGTDPAISALAVVMQRYASPEEIALAREAARALKRLRAHAALLPALASPDPEVRAAAAASGAGGAALCDVLAKDPWPMVRIAAAQGLAGTSAACLSAGLVDPNERVSIATARAAIDAPAPALRPALRRLAANQKAATEARAHAFVALAALGDLEPATAAMKTHLAQGEIVPLALAAVRAFAVKGDVGQLIGALRSASPRVVRAAAQASLIEGSPQACAAVDAAIQGADPRLANVLRRLVSDFGPAVDAGDDPALTDPE